MTTSSTPVTLIAVLSFSFTGQVAEKLDKVDGVVDHGIICSNQ